MKRWTTLLLILNLICISTNAQNQNVAINNDGTTPDEKAILDIKSTDKGILIPRMTTAQRTAIASAAKGLTVFDNTTNSFWYFNGTSWAELAPGWKLRGNAATTNLDFIGTTDAKPLNFRFNNYRVGTLTQDNVAFGLSSGIGGNANVAIGKYALLSNSANNTVGIGDSALARNSGEKNTAVGSKALYFNSDGLNNTALGFESLYSNTGGQLNTAVGSNSLFSNTGGYSNIALGTAALYNNTEGDNNIAVGVNAQFDNSIGRGNVAIGSYGLENVTTGNYNTAVGMFALNEITTGSSNTAIGYNTGASFNNISNSTCIGNGATITLSNAMRFGNANVTKWGFGRNVTTGVLQVGDDATNGNGAYLSAAGTWVNISDRYKKENFSELNGEDVLNKIMQLPISRWSYKGDNGVTHIGPMAQDFYRIFNVGDNEKAISSVDPAGVALRAIQELNNQNKKLQDEVDELKTLVKQLMDGKKN